MQARQIGLVDFIFPGSGEVLDDHIQTHVALMLRDGIARKGPWKRKLDLSLSGLALARADELAEMAKDFWSPRSERYHARRAAFVRKAKPTRTPLRFALHRRVQAKLQPDEEETAEFDDIATYERKAENEMASRLRAVILAEMGSATANANNNNTTANGTKHKPSLQALLPPRDLLTPPVIDSKTAATLFSCHYQDFSGQDYSQHQDQPMLTPPESPMPLYLPKMDSKAKFGHGGRRSAVLVLVGGGGLR